MHSDDQRPDGGTFVSSLIELLNGTLMRSGVEQTRTESITLGFREEVCRRFGGKRVYIARRFSTARTLAAKAKRLRERLSVRDVAARLGVTPNYVYRLLKMSADPVRAPALPRPSRTRTQKGRSK